MTGRTLSKYFLWKHSPPTTCLIVSYRPVHQSLPAWASQDKEDKFLRFLVYVPGVGAGQSLHVVASLADCSQQPETQDRPDTRHRSRQDVHY